MIKVAAGEAKNKFGSLIDASQHEPVTITKHDRPYSVVLSYETFQKLEELEDFLIAERAKEAVKRGVLGTEETKKVIEGILNDNS